ncbi:L-aspartate oxidase [Candidatus Filomicrobium marinum]|uniref:L-aspartate oxidase n=1 Tax=Candidatus Filomicrobium marinum TaxID=1608628 RepID=A0A0D6JAB8_9HYPH|nr:L-aspartate oxidase [Candidatus Filomicrobium marinum]CFW98114.1 L-aspartate oxidase [Candidatus Filomicrobium marinum]CPR14845.1 L-aspartate oxidase [Candidatus Filomicrobium marinum]
MTQSSRHAGPVAGFKDPSCELSGRIVIVGAGLAGLFTALRLAPRPVVLIAAAPLGQGASSAWAQGGIAAAVGEGDTPEAHAADTVLAGSGLVDKEVARIITEAAPQRIRELLSYGVPFDRDLAGHFVLSREAAHSAKRVVRVSGDRAGAAIMQALIASARTTPSIEILENYEAKDLEIRDGRVTGVRLLRNDGPDHADYEVISGTAVVIATGGVGKLYAITTNPAYSRGEALAFAARAGAVIADPEFVQFHPTAIDVPGDPAPLATEALRGEGATLVNRAGERFLKALHPDAELAPRDLVARAVFSEIAAGRGAYLDCRKTIGLRFPDAFPGVYQKCREAGLDPVNDLIPIAPAAHYHMGGIATDMNGRTTVEGLWAVGEAACTGLHGANRLASNSLLEAIVVGGNVAEDIAKITTPTKLPIKLTSLMREGSNVEPTLRTALIKRLRRTMSGEVGVVREQSGLNHALRVLREVEDQAGGDITLANIVLTSRLITTAALNREESRGAHMRSDFPDTSPMARHSLLRLTDLDKTATITDISRQPDGATLTNGRLHQSCQMSG